MTSRRALCRAFALALIWFIVPRAISQTVSDPASLPLLTEARQIRQMSAAEALKGYPVRLKGVVLFYRQEIFHELTIQDHTGGIYVTNTSSRKCIISPGDIVEIEGISGPGSFAPVVVLSNLTVLAHGELPEAREVPYERLVSGAEDCQWVKVRGIVHATHRTQPDRIAMLQLDLATGGGRVPIRLSNYDAEVARTLVDAEITVQGVCVTVFNQKRQMLGLRLSVPNLNQIRVEQPAPVDPFASPTRTINSLNQFAPLESTGHRVKVEGVVLLQQPGRSVFIRDDTQGLWVKTLQATPLAVGDKIEVIGFPASGEYSPTFEDAIYRKIGSGPPPLAEALDTVAARTGKYDIDLVQMEGELIEWTQTRTEHHLAVKENNWLFWAQIPRTGAFTPPPEGSRVRLTGICLVQVGNMRWPQSFRLQLRSPADVELVRLPGWWTQARVMMALGVTSALCIAAFVWIVTLKRQVRGQMEIIQQKVEREAVLEERTRIAREFHDTLEQQLGATVLQLQAARSRLDTSPDFVRHVLRLVESMLRHTLSEARHSVWDLRARALEDGSLGTALSTTANYVRNGSGIAVNVTVKGDPRPLPGRIENNLLRISQEATANAVKHAAPKRIGIELCYESHSVRLTVEDDGKGFDINATTTAGEAGHFGLLGMRERAEKIGGRFSASSTPGEGARIEITVPLTRDQAGDPTETQTDSLS